MSLIPCFDLNYEISPWIEIGLLPSQKKKKKDIGLLHIQTSLELA